FKNISFPLFLFNGLQVLGNSRESLGEEVHLPGQGVVLRLDAPGGKVKVTGPDGKAAETLNRSPQGGFVFGSPNRTGIYHARWEPKGLFPFVVNQFDFRESDLAPRGLVPDGVPPEKADAYKIKIGYNPVAGTRVTRPNRQDWWKPLAVAAFAVLLL